MKAIQFRKLIREEVRRALKEAKATNVKKRTLNEVDVNPDPNKEISGSAKFDFDKFAKTCPVVLSSEYEGEWMDEVEDWDEDFVPLQNALYAKFTDGEDFALMIGMGDDIFNALAIKNVSILQDPTIKKLIKKIMGYGGLEIEKGKVAESRKGLKESVLSYKVGDSVVVDNLEDYPFKVKAIFPNKAKMLADVQKMTTPDKFKKLVKYLKDSEEDNWDLDNPDGSPWVYVVATGTSSEDRRYNLFPFVVPSEIVSSEEE
ncbi:hypothetical protein UFOVP450_4 [uncultured Caudovirales phage]|uniref:Uncharacterized protein n=1 Tax=uncultured Caudovirales phage TaxID=2100421 RepID=A0A6J5MFG9_9CAUD|nr:hypothetical protein UFOVP450_4 [uncultured Caudovirales phage]